LRRAVVLALLALLVAAPAASAAYPWSKRVASATSYAKKRSGRVSFAVKTTDGHVYGRNIHQTHYSAARRSRRC